MAFTGALPGQRPGYQVVEADAETLPAVADMISAAFGLDRADVARTFASPPMLASPGTGIYVARGRGRCVSTATVSRGALTGIWSMATPPDMQGQGAGRAALVGAMAAERARGAQAFSLIATPAGRPLYDSVGFVTVEEFPLHLSGESAQF